MFLLGHVINSRAVHSLFYFDIISPVASVRKSEHTNTGDNTVSDYSRSYLAGLLPENTFSYDTSISL